MADGYQLFVNPLGLLLGSFENFDMIIEALNGNDLLEKLTERDLQPDILLTFSIQNDGEEFTPLMNAKEVV